MDVRTDGQMDVRTDGQMDVHTYGRKDGLNIPCILQDIVPLGPLPKRDISNGDRMKTVGVNKMTERNWDISNGDRIKTVRGN